MVRALLLLSSLAAGSAGLGAAPARADAPPPTQALASDPAPAGPALGLSADGAAMVLGDFAARLDLSVFPAFSVLITVGASRRASTDDVLLEAGATLWFLGRGLEGPHLSALVGGAWAGPWNESAGSETARRGPESAVLRAGGEVGWQFLWGPVSISLAGGAHAALPLGGERGVGLEPRARAALGLVF